MEVTQYIIYPTSWLYKIAEYTALEVLRKDNKRKIAEEKSAIENVYENNFEIEIQDKDILNCLDNEKRHIIYLRYWERYSFKEIALMLNINYSTLKAKHKKAKLVLKTYLKKEI